MAVNQYINWTWLIETGRIQEATSDEDYVIVGSFSPGNRTSSTAARTREYAIKVSDFMATVGDGTFTGLSDTPGSYTPDSMVASNLAGTELEFRPVPADTNTWDISQTAFVDPLTGNDTTGLKGDGNLPFKTITAAQAASNFVLGLPGNYSGTITLADGVHYHFMPDVVFTAFSKLRDGGVASTVKITGHATFGSNSIGIETTAASNWDIECENFENTRQVIYCLGTTRAEVYLRCHNIFCNTNNGGRYANRMTNGAKITIECDQFYCVNTIAVHHSSTNIEPTHFILRCPDVKILDGGVQLGKVIISDPSLSLNKISEVDFMGGSAVNENAAQTTFFGTFDSLLYNTANTHVILASTTYKHTFKNGTANAGTSFGLAMHFAAISGTVELDNIKLKSNTNSINAYLSAYAGLPPNRTLLLFKNCDFESVLPMIIGNSKECHFNNCTFKTTGVGETAIIDYDIQNPLVPRIMYFINCVGQLDNGGAGEFLANNVAGSVYGMINTPTTEVLGATVIDTWLGHSVVPTLQLPNII